MRSCVLVALVACGHGSDPAPAPAPVPAGSSAPDAPCTALPFAASTPVPEASGAAWLTVAGKLVLVTMGDSGQHGAYGLVDPDTGDTLEQGQLPLGSASDDLEGLAARHGVLYGLNSAGWITTWKHDDAAHAFQLVDGPYAIGSGDMACAAQKFNCRRNYEGLALSDEDAGSPPREPASASSVQAQPAETPASRSTGSGSSLPLPACIGVALAKADGTLYCLTEEAGRLVVHADRALKVEPHDRAADVALALDDPDTLWLGDNLLGGNAIARITGWRDLAHAKVAPVGLFGVGFSEGIAARGSDVYRFSDMGGAPSLMAKFRCPRPGR